MMTILRGTIVQDVMWTEGYGAISGILRGDAHAAWPVIQTAWRASTDVALSPTHCS